MAVKLTLAFMTLFLWSAAFGKDCRWNKDTEYPDGFPPLLMDLKTWTSVLPVMDEGERVIKLKAGTKVVVACPGTEITALGKELVKAKCTGGTIRVKRKKFTMSQLGCKKRITESVQKNIGSCGKGGELSAIGFTLPGYDFYELIRVCFDPVAQSNLYSTHTIRGAHTPAKDNNPDRPGFKADSGFYNVPTNLCYSQKMQKSLMKKLLENPDVINVKRSFYFARGHMSPDADFCTEQEQDATYYFINAAPQWQSFNNGNWKAVEFDTRALAAQRGTDLKIWSGAWGVLQLNDKNNNLVDIYLGLIRDKKVVPAPDITWKVVYDPATNEAAAIVGVNNPYVGSFPAPVCTNGTLCSQLKWLTLDFEDLEAGATYCCTVQDLAAAIPNVPQDLEDATLLTG